VSGPESDIYGDGRGRSPTLESQLHGRDPGIPFIPHLPSEDSRGAPVPVGAPEGAPSAGGPRAGEPYADPRAGEPYADPRAGAPYGRSETVPSVLPIPEPATYGHIAPGSMSPRSGPPFEVPRSETPPYSEEEEPRDGPAVPPGARTPGPGVSRAATSRSTPRTVRRFPSGPGDLGYDDAERARHERFAELERQLADIAQDAAEAEVRRDHDYHDKEEDRDRHFGDNESRREAHARQLMDEMSSILGRGPVPSGVHIARGSETPETDVPPLPVPGPGYGAPTLTELGVPEQAESVIASIRRASSESAARHADDIRDIVHGEREEMAKQIQQERDDARNANEALVQQVMAERARADDECKDRIQELEDELARVRAELDHEKQQRINDEEMRREDEARRGGERDDEMRQQLSEITDLLLSHREEFARKKEVVEEHWERKQEWREEDARRWDEMYRMVQGIIDDRAEDRERCEEERRAAAEKPCK
jgi:hypothetical protein